MKIPHPDSAKFASCRKELGICRKGERVHAANIRKSILGVCVSQSPHLHDVIATGRCTELLVLAKGNCSYTKDRQHYLSSPLPNRSYYHAGGCFKCSSRRAINPRDRSCFRRTFGSGNEGIACTAHNAAKAMGRRLPSSWEPVKLVNEHYNQDAEGYIKHAPPRECCMCA